MIDPTYQTYPFPEDADVEGILRIRYRLPGTPDVWYELENKSYRVYDDKIRLSITSRLELGASVHVPDVLLAGDQPQR